MNIYDIAQKAGVSTATVSRVLNGSRNVSEKSRRRVQEVMASEGFFPNAYARMLSSSDIKTVGIICPDISDENHARPVAILQRLLSQKGFDFLLACVENNYGDKSKSIELLMSRKVDAIITIGSFLPELSGGPSFEAAAAKVPIVVLNGMIKCRNVYCVLCDEGGAIRELVGSLCSTGRRDILYLYDSETYSGHQKLSGYRKGLVDHGIPYDQRLVVRVAQKHQTPSMFYEAYSAAQEILRENVPVSAVIAADDMLAVAAQKAFIDAGHPVPTIGFNNTTIGLCSTPTISSIDNFTESLCETAVNLLMNVLEGYEAAPKVLLSSRLVERESFCPSGQHQTPPVRQ